MTVAQVPATLSLPRFLNIPQSEQFDIRLQPAQDNLNYYTYQFDKFIPQSKAKQEIDSLLILGDKEYIKSFLQFKNEENLDMDILDIKQINFESKVFDADKIPKTIIILDTNTKIEDQLKFSFDHIFKLIKQLTNLKIKSPINLIYVYTDQNNLSAKALSGFFSAVGEEQPLIHGRVLGAMNDIIRDVPRLIRTISELLSSAEREIIYSKEQFWIRRYKKLSDFSPIQTGLLRNKGVYLITGGMGGLGYLIAEYLATHYSAKLILLGRSKLSLQMEAKIKQLEELGAEVNYYSCDITNKEKLIDVLSSVRKQFESLNGIIHCAGISKSKIIANKTILEAKEVINPKIQGILNLDELTKNDKLDCLILFSSISAIFFGGGESDYAYANSFLDHFAEQRDSFVMQKIRYGRTISINWPLWKKRRDADQSRNY